MIYQSILDLAGKRKILALLLDPESVNTEMLPALLSYANDSGVSFILVGGSLVNHPVEPLINNIRDHTSLPVILFPGNPNQLSDNADGLLLLSLISGRNPEFLIGNHVVAARFIKDSKMEVIPTGYMLVENGGTSSVEYISNTKPLPRDKPQIAVSTAIAGELLGMKLIYMEGGSGATGVIPASIISSVKKNINIPLVVGGGIKVAADLQQVFNAGADVAVIGNAFEKDPAGITQFAAILRQKPPELS